MLFRSVSQSRYLFSGIGGFALAAKWNGFRTLAFCDCEPYAQAVLKKHWPDVPCHKDIREVRGELYAGVTLLTGGFPCQPFSVAGKQRGKDDNRYLWPEMLRVIREARPAWIIGENVAGIVNMALDTVCADLEAEGYEVEPLIVPACAVDAPHRRDRVWIIAYTEQSRWGSGEQNIFEETGNVGEHVFFNSEGDGRNIKSFWEAKETDWSMDIKSSICRKDDGISNSVDRIRGLGNAIVPQVAAEIIRCIGLVHDVALSTTNKPKEK